MKKIIKFSMMFAAFLTMTAGFTACGDDDKDIDIDNAAALDYSSEYGEQWANYMTAVSNLLKQDAQTLYDAWKESYAAEFKEHNSHAYPSAIACVEQILDGCIDIAGEVGDQKIGEPYRLYKAGRAEEAVYAVESWYSWHSREDYRNNIYSIRNAFFGSRNGQVSPQSMSALLEERNPALNSKAVGLINDAANAIMTIPQPFRSNIGDVTVSKAMDACASLGDFIENELKPYFATNINDNTTLNPIIAQYVDGVVLPTYKELAEKNAALDQAVRAFKSNPSNNAFTTCANAWLIAREPWESSEAFLFGPVDEMGLDPNMDSWPLDQAQIAQILQSQDFTNLYWKEGESDDKIESAQNLRGFHTLEYLIFKDGKARKVK